MRDPRRQSQGSETSSKWGIDGHRELELGVELVGWDTWKQTHELDLCVRYMSYSASTLNPGVALLTLALFVKMEGPRGVDVV